MAYGLSTTMSKPKTSPTLTIPDSRVSNLEGRVSALETWAQRHGMKYKGEKR
jgi:hypothetical protein